MRKEHVYKIIGFTTAFVGGGIAAKLGSTLEGWGGLYGTLIGLFSVPLVLPLLISLFIKGFSKESTHFSYRTAVIHQYIGVLLFIVIMGIITVVGW